MKKGENDIERLRHILKACDFILLYTHSVSDDDFFRNEVLKFACLKNLEIIGEAANFLSDELQSKYKHIEWAKIIGARHYYIHVYFNIDWLQIWDTIKKHIQPLKNEVEEIINNY